MTQTNENQPLEKRSRGGKARTLTVAVVALLLVCGASMVAASHFGGGPLHRGGAMDPEIAKEKIEFVTSFVLGKLDASEEQESEIQRILESTVDDLSGLAVEHRAGRELFHEVLTQETIDREALEQIRVAQMALADEVSKRLVETLADAAGVLSAEQRAELVEMAARHHGH